MFVFRKLSKQFDKAVLESNKLCMAELQDRKVATLKRQKEIQGSVQDDYFKKVRLERDKIMRELMEYKESPTGYRSIFDEIRETCKNYNTI